MARADDSESNQPASPVCYREELDQPSLEGAELIGWLNELLEGERAGAQGLHEIAKRYTGELAALLATVARDEGRFCVMLRRHIARLGGTPSDVTGVFYEKLLAKETLAKQLALLDRGQSAVALSLQKFLPRIHDAQLAADLREMLDVHIRNIEACAAIETPP